MVESVKIRKSSKQDRGESVYPDMHPDRHHRLARTHQRRTTGNRRSAIATWEEDAMTSYHLVDPELAPMLALMPPGVLDAETLPEWRARIGQAPQTPDDPAVLIKERRLDRADGSTLRLLVYRPVDAAEPLPAVLHLHGGGFVLGAPEMSKTRCQEFARELGCIIVSVDYRLAPENPYPSQLDDAYAALQWLGRDEGRLGIDPARIALMGESAGGGLAAALAIAARDRGGCAIAFQLLTYPMLDDRTNDVDPGYAGEFVWTPAHNQFGWASLLGEGSASPLSAPARVDDPAGLPPTFIATGAIDLFVNEDIVFARRLIAAGVPVELHVYPGAFHGFDMLAQASASVALRAHSLSALRRAIRGEQAGGGEA